MSKFFHATRVAVNALYADFKFKPYYNFLFHLDAITTFICHILRAIYDLAALALRLLITPLCLLNPLSWPELPEHFMNIADNLAGTIVSLVSIAIHPLIVVLRTLSSIIFGYEREASFDNGIQGEEDDLNMAMAIW